MTTATSSGTVRVVTVHEADERPSSRTAFTAARTGTVNGLQVVVTSPSGTSGATTTATVPVDTQERVRKLLLEKRADYIHLLEFSETSDTSMQTLFPECSDQDFEDMQAASQQVANYNRTLAERSCIDNQNYASVRLGARVLGIVGTGACQIIQQVGSDRENTTLQWVGTLGQFIIGLLWGTAEVVTVRKENQRTAAETGLRTSEAALNKLLKAPRENMDRCARELLRRWVSLTSQCDQREAGQIKDFIVSNWSRSLPRIQRLALQRIGLQSKVNELLEPMTSAVRAIELAHGLSQTGISRDLGEAAVEFEQNRFSGMLVRLQDKLRRQQSTTSEGEAATGSRALSSPTAVTVPTGSSSTGTVTATGPSTLRPSEQSAASSASDSRALTLTSASDGKEAEGTEGRRVERVERKASAPSSKTGARLTLVQRYEADYRAARDMGKHIRQRSQQRGRSSVVSTT